MRLKTYLRSTIWQERLSNLALLNIEREYVNKVIIEDIEDITNTFGERNGRQALFFE